MAARKKTGKKTPAKPKTPPPRLVRRTITLEADKLDFARQVLEVKTDAEVIRLALDHLLSHFVEHTHDDEEE